MSDVDLYVSHTLLFGGIDSPYEQADYAVVGVPFDGTSTYRKGARFAPFAIREASLNIETYSFRSTWDAQSLKTCDLGDLHVSQDTEITLKHLEASLRSLLEAGKVPVLIGGEHTITLGAMRGVGGGDNTAIISFDAHLDLRDEYMELRTSHTTFMRRLNDQVKPRNIVEVGTRAASGEELTYAKEAGIHYFTVKQLRDKGLGATVKSIKKVLEGCERIYLTIDMDVLDPAFAPAVQNPEPDGLSTDNLLTLVTNLVDSRTVGLDLVEVTPAYGKGVTCVQAAKTLFEVLCHLEKVRRTNFASQASQ
ncbi:MAG: agmatinase [Candidatus Bathyarchaeota archaeon]|nr:agmatinase [Candidatus Bathyarchaeota archaeon]